jgi:hypothetical protein
MIIKITNLMLCVEINVVFPYAQRKQIHSVKNVQFFNVKPGGVYSNHRALKG